MTSTEPACGGCRHFNGSAPAIEAALPGLSTLSSAYAAVRADDGLCAVHDRYVAASRICDAYSVSHRPQALGR